MQLHIATLWPKHHHRVAIVAKSIDCCLWYGLSIGYEVWWLYQNVNNGLISQPTSADSGTTRAPLYYLRGTQAEHRGTLSTILCAKQYCVCTMSEPCFLYSFFIAHSIQFVHHVPLKQRTTRLININYRMPTYITEVFQFLYSQFFNTSK